VPKAADCYASCSATEAICLHIATTAIPPHTGRENGDIGVNHVRKDTAYEDEVHTDRVVETSIVKAGRVRK